MKILTLYDGTLQAKIALKYGMEKARGKSGQLLVLQVFQSALFIDYGAGPAAEQAARAEAARHLLDAQKLIQEAGCTDIVRVISEEGDPVEQALRLAGQERVDLILASPRFKKISRGASCPVYIMPGAILVPVDGSLASKTEIAAVVSEARASQSRVFLLGIVPVHIYSAGETEEVERIKKAAETSIRKIKKALDEEKIESAEVVRFGYPDEEILKAAQEYEVSLIMLPAGGKTPSELAKAAAILMDEPQRLKRLIYLMPASLEA
jgi:nucleotide-binding universal stress UspA family protein